MYIVELLLSWISPSAFATLILDGAAIPAYMLIHPWTAITSLFLHSTSIFHVLFNMISLWVIGPTLEKMMGHIHFLFLYLISGIAGSFGLVLWASIVPSGWSLSAYGASGAIFGLFAAILVVYRRVGVNMRSMIFWIAVNFLMPVFIQNIAWQAHLGGFIFGGLLAWLLTLRSPKVRKLTMNVRMAIFGGAIFVVCAGLMLWLSTFSPYI
jgi:membrane associated rhomboid family serine protease